MQKEQKKEIKQIAKKKAKKQVGKAIKSMAGASPLSPLNMLERHSGYWNSLMDPFKHPGVSIPDDNVYRTCPFQGITRFQVPANAQGIAGVMIPWGVVDSTSGGNFGIFTTVSGSTSTALAWQGLLTGYGDQLTPLLSQQRLVSGIISATFQGATQTDSGRFINSAVPPNYLGTVLYNQTKINDILKLPYTNTTPVATRYSSVKYLPGDATASYSFSVYGGSPQVVVPTTTPPVSVPLSESTLPKAGCAYLVADGLVANQVVEFVLCQNFEFIPKSNTANFLSPNVSKSDPIELSLVENQIAEDPYKAVEVDRAMLQSKSAIAPQGKVVEPHPAQESTFFEKLIGGVEAALPMVEKVLSTGAKVASVAAPLLL